MTPNYPTFDEAKTAAAKIIGYYKKDGTSLADVGKAGWIATGYGMSLYPGQTPKVGASACPDDPEECKKLLCQHMEALVASGDGKKKGATAIPWSLVFSLLAKLVAGLLV